MDTLIAANKRNTWLLFGLFIILLTALGTAIAAYWGAWWFGSIITGIVAFFVVIFAFTEGDNVMLNISGARQITHDDAPQLFNVVEELSIAAGVPMPKVYIIDEEAPNAFATGRDPQHASVAITTGLLHKLQRDELQGVMAHELSHIRNRDTLFAVMMGILVGTVALLSDLFLRSMWFGGGRRRSSSDRGGGGIQIVILLVGLLLAILAPIFAKLLQLAMSRQREYLADTSGAELTRYPEGLARALEKISADPTPLRAANRATQHLYIANPMKKLNEKDSVFSTHPPMSERIRRLYAMR
jgi:heat shock protein HtpX